MATNSELRKQIDLLISSLDRAGVNTDNFKKKLSEAGNEKKKLVELMNKVVSSLENADNSASSLYQTLKGISDELGRSNKFLNRTKGLYNKITDDARKLRDDEQGIADLNKRQLASIQRRYKTNSKYLSEQLSGLEEEQRILQDKAAAGERLTRAERARLAQYPAAIKMAKDQGRFVRDLNKNIDNRLDLEKQISKNMGVTGALVGGTGALMERLGMRSGIFHDAMEEANATMREQAKILGKNADILDRMKIASEGFSIVARGFGQALFDPAAIVGKIVSAFLDVNKTQTEFIQLSGKSAKTLNGVQTEISTLTDLLQISAELTKQIGLDSTSIFSPDQIAQISDAKELLGISAEQGAQLGMIMKLTGESADQLGKSIYDNVDAGVSKKLVYDDILSASDDIVASTGGNTEELARSASAARKLGMDLQKVNQIADGLMEFETSIGNELEAQLLTGKNINLSKARELALNNDLEGVAEELSKNGASAAEFAKMNRIQQESLAKALGMSREELGKMVLTEEARAGMTDEQIAAARGVTLEQSKQIDIQARIQKLVAKLAQAFAPVLEAVVPIVEALLTVVGPIASGIGKVANYLSGWVKPLLVAYGLFKGIVGFNKVMLGLQAAGAIKAKIANKLAQVGLFTDRQAAFWKGRQTYFENLKNGLVNRNLRLENASLLTAIRKSLLNKKDLAVEKLKTYQTQLRSWWENSIYKTGLKGLGLAIKQNAQQFLAVTYAKAKAMYEGLTLQSIIAQTAGIIRNIGKLVIELGVRLGIASAALLANSAVTFGVGAAIAVGAALAAYAAYKAVTADDMVSPGYGKRTLMGPEGAIQLNNKDTVIAGTNLFGGEQESVNNTIGGVDLSPLVTEIRQMKTEVSSVLKSILNKEGTVTLDGNKVGSALVLGSYKSS